MGVDHNHPITVHINVVSGFCVLEQAALALHAVRVADLPVRVRLPLFAPLLGMSRPLQSPLAAGLAAAALIVGDLSFGHLFRRAEATDNHHVASTTSAL